VLLLCRNIEWDAVEAPSQMQEKWVYDKDTFNSFARHWQTNQTVPPELFERIKASRTYRKGESLNKQWVMSDRSDPTALHTDHTAWQALQVWF